LYIIPILFKIYLMQTFLMEIGVKISAICTKNDIHLALSAIRLTFVTKLLLFNIFKKNTMQNISKSLFLWLGSALALCLVACQPKQLSPEMTAQKFITAIEHEEWDVAKTIGTASTIELLDMIKTMSAMVDAKDKVEKKATTIAKMTCNIIKNTAHCAYCCGTDGKDNTLDLVQEKGKWLVDLKKDDQNKANP
jgi:hypothetical protein